MGWIVTELVFIPKLGSAFPPIQAKKKLNGEGAKILINGSIRIGTQTNPFVA